MKQAKMKRLTLTCIFATLASMVSVFIFTVPVHAGLPASIQGQTIPSLAPILDKVTPAVVNISTEGKIQVRQSPLFSDPFFRHFFDFPEVTPRERRTHSLGSGVVINASKGLVITNHHVIKHAEEITVILRDGRKFSATLVGSDPETDIAILKIPNRNLIDIKTSNSDQLRVGDFVVAIGNPFGLGQTVTSGIVSALGRSGLGLKNYEDFIQTDASINPGNSGGALINLRGELVGINTAILAPNGGNIGIGFAIPVNMVKTIMAQLVAHGEVRRGRLGIQTQNLNTELARAFNLKKSKGAVITHVDAGSPADKAGAKVGDVVTAINDRLVHNADELRTRVGLLQIGNTIKLSLLRGGKPLMITAKIAEPVHTTIEGKRLHDRLDGLVIGLIPESSPSYGRIEGIMIHEVKPGTPAATTGLRKGDVITSINHDKVTTIEQGLKAAAKSHNEILLNINRGNSALFLLIQ